MPPTIWYVETATLWDDLWVTFALLALAAAVHQSARLIQMLGGWIGRLRKGKGQPKATRTRYPSRQQQQDIHIHIKV